MENNNASKTGKEVFFASAWRIGEKIGASSATLLISIILARILTPSDYGKVSLIIILVNILNVVVDGGFGQALIQKKKVSDADYGTAFIINMIVCSTLYIVLFVSAPLLEKLLSAEDICNVIRVCGVVLIISGAKNTIQAYISRHLMFKYYFFATLSGTIISGVVAIIMAYKGFGIWSLVAQLLINPAIDTILLYSFLKWKPVLTFSKISFKEMFGFGSRILCRDLLNTVFDNVRGLFIGAFYSTSQLAYYENGRKIPAYSYLSFDSALRSVFFPVFSKEQGDLVKLKKHLLKTAKICSFISFPILFGLFGCAHQLVLVIWTEKWIGSVIFLQIFCVIWSVNSIQALNQQIILALGRSDICLKQEVVIKIMAAISIIISVRIGVLAIALGQLIVTIASLFVNLWPNRKLINCTISQQLLCCLPTFLISVAMAFMVYCIGLLGLELHLKLIIQIISGIAFYYVLCKLFKIKEMDYIFDILKERFRRKH